MQHAANIEALCQLWGRTLQGPPLSRDVSASWLAKLSYFEMCKLVHKVQKLNDKYRRTLKLTQLHTYFHQLATLELKDKANGQFNRSVR